MMLLLLLLLLFPEEPPTPWTTPPEKPELVLLLLLLLAGHVNGFSLLIEELVVQAEVVGLAETKVDYLLLHRQIQD
jgi:hypothetical protein